MNTITTRQRLLPGQALLHTSRGRARLVVVEGEVIVQPSAQWLAETLVLAPARRVAAPAAVDIDASWGVVAVSRARVAVEAPAGWLERLGFRRGASGSPAPAWR